MRTLSWSSRFRAGILLAAAALLAAVLQAGLHGQVFRTMVDVVSVGVTVVDGKGGLVTDLSAAEFDIFEDGARQDVKFFSRGDAVAAAPELHLGIMFDTSDSMDEDIALSRSAAIKFLNAQPDAVDVTLVDFDAKVRVARFEPPDFPRLVERIRARKPEGMTAFYDALGVYLDGAAGQQGRRIVVVYSDGADNRSSLTFPEIVDLIKASDVTIYGIGFLNNLSGSEQFDARSRLQRLVEPTGGQAFFPSSLKDIETAYERVLGDIRAQYTIGYVSSNASANGRWRKVDIKLRRPGLKVRARQGYYAPYRRQP